jgi:hypothetical protein
MPKIHLPEKESCLYRNVKVYYGEDSEISKFLKEYTVPSGKAIVERIESNVPDGGSVSSLGVGVRLFGQENRIVASHKYEFGRIVLIRKEAPVMQTRSSYFVDYSGFFIVDESEIYALRRLR